jgi:ABC-type multidrug transport system ATPase subunit
MRFEARSLKREIAGRVLYRDLTLELSAGEVLAVRGESGSGKTRLLRQLAALDPLEEGELRLDGRTPRQWGFTRWRAEVCFVPQPAPILRDTPAELCERVAGFRVQRQRSGRDPRPIAEGWGLVRARWEQPWKELSLGERQRALLAILLARDPAVLLLDEPTATLDPDATAAVEASLRGRTCVWVTHLPEQAERVGSRVLSIGAGSHA